jgi:error-prone DNA polymerase
MGFYAPAQIVRDARLHGVAVRPVCVNVSAWDCTLEPADGRYLAVRLGLRMAKGLSSVEADTLIDRRGAGYASMPDLWRRSGVPVASLERLAEADGFHALGLDRRQAIWAIRGLSDSRLPLFDDADSLRATGNEPAVTLPRMTAGRGVVEDYRSTGLSLHRHPVAFLRSELSAQRIVRCGDLAGLRDGRRVTVAGIVLVRQRPGSARGVLFVTIEDETGHANLILWPSVFDRQRRLVLSASMIACRGKLQKEGEVIHVIAEELTDLSNLLRSVELRDDGGAGTTPSRVAAGAGIKVPTRDFR